MDSCRLREESNESTWDKDEENLQQVGKETCPLYLCFIINYLVFSQDLINQGREKVVEATNSVTAARIQPLEDIISTIVSEMGDGKVLNFIRQRMTILYGHSAHQLR